MLWLAQADHFRTQDGLEVYGVALVDEQVLLADFSVTRLLLGFVLEAINETVEGVDCLCVLKIDKAPFIGQA